MTELITKMVENTKRSEIITKRADKITAIAKTILKYLKKLK